MKGVAILGVEMFEARRGLRVEDYSGYEFACGGDWQEFVRANSSAALDFIRSHPAGEEHGYILTAASEREFRQLRYRRVDGTTMCRAILVLRQ